MSVPDLAPDDDDLSFQLANRRTVTLFRGLWWRGVNHPVSVLIKVKHSRGDYMGDNCAGARYFGANSSSKVS